LLYAVGEQREREREKFIYRSFVDTELAGFWGDCLLRNFKLVSFAIE